MLTVVAEIMQLLKEGLVYFSLLFCHTFCGIVLF